MQGLGRQMRVTLCYAAVSMPQQLLDLVKGAPRIRHEASVGMPQIVNAKLRYPSLFSDTVPDSGYGDKAFLRLWIWEAHFSVIISIRYQQFECSII